MHEKESKSHPYGHGVDHLSYTSIVMIGVLYLVPILIVRGFSLVIGHKVKLKPHPRITLQRRELWT